MQLAKSGRVLLPTPLCIGSDKFQFSQSDSIVQSVVVNCSTDLFNLFIGAKIKAEKFYSPSSRGLYFISPSLLKFASKANLSKAVSCDLPFLTAAAGANQSRKLIFAIAPHHIRIIILESLSLYASASRKDNQVSYKLTHNQAEFHCVKHYVKLAYMA